MSLDVFIIVDRITWNYFQDLPSLNTLSNLNALKADIALLPSTKVKDESENATSILDTTTIIKSKMLNLSLKYC